VLRVNPGIDDETDGAPDVGFQAAVVGVRVLVEADVFAKALGVKPPTLRIGGVDMELAESYLKFTIKALLERNLEDVAFFDKMISPGLLNMLENVVKTPFEHLTYTKAIEILEKVDKKWEYPVKWGIDLQTEHERYLTEEHFKKPVILTDYPKEIKAFYMRQNDDGKTVAAMDVLVPGVGEIIGGSQREDRLEVLHDKIVKAGLNPEDYWWYLELRKWGSCPHAGFGCGFERLVRFTTGMENIRDVIPFPRAPKLADF